MAFEVKVTGYDPFVLTKEVVQNVKIQMDIPKDSNARSKDLGATIVVTGRILTGLEGTVVDQSIKAGQWSLVPAEKSEAYRNLTVDVIAAGQVVRQYIFPQAFCVDYSEHYDDQAGVGTFTAIFRQKKDQLDTIQINGGYAVS